MSKDYLKEGLLSINKGELDSAEEILKEGLKKEPKNEKLLTLLGWVLSQKEKYEEMIEVYKNLVKINPLQSFSLFFNLGKAYFMLKDYRSAIEAFNKTLELAPNHKNALFYLSACYERLGDIKNSKKYLSKLVQLGTINEDVKDVSIQEGLLQYHVDEYLKMISSAKTLSVANFTKAFLFGTWSINNDYTVLWSDSFVTENFIEHTVFRGEGKVVFHGEPLVIEVLKKDEEILISGRYLVGIDDLFDGAFNKNNFIRIKGPRKILIPKRLVFAEEVQAKYVFKRERVFALIGKMKIKTISEDLLKIEEGHGVALLS